MKRLPAIAFATASMLCAHTAQAELYISIVQGLSGAPRYQDEFDSQRESISAAAETMTTRERIAVFQGEEATREALMAHFDTLRNTMTDSDRAAIYLVGHGSYDGYDYKFNLPGLDITGEDLRQVLEGLPGRNHFLLNTSSTSGAMLTAISGDEQSEDTGGNILISATRNGNERNATHFGRFFAEALASDEADINKNSQISVQEAFDFAARGVESYFESEGKLATEHPQLRGDGASAFNLSRLDELAMPVESADPELNDLLEERLAIDSQIEELQLRRNEYSNADYVERLQALILESAQVNERIEAMQQDEAGGGQ